MQTRPFIAKTPDANELTYRNPSNAELKQCTTIGDDSLAKQRREDEQRVRRSTVGVAQSNRGQGRGGRTRGRRDQRMPPSKSDGPGGGRHYNISMLIQIFPFRAGSSSSTRPPDYEAETTNHPLVIARVHAYLRGETSLAAATTTEVVFGTADKAWGCNTAVMPLSV